MLKMSQHHKATVISSEVERYIKSMSRLEEHHKAEVERHVESMTRLDPPVPFAFTDSEGVNPNPKSEGHTCILI